MCHLPYSVQKFSIHGEYECNMSISVPTQSRPSSACRVYKPDRMFCFPVATEKELIGFILMFCYVTIYGALSKLVAD